MEFCTFDQFKNAVTGNGFPEPSTEQYVNFNKYSREDGRISSKEEAAMCLSQLIHESAGLTTKAELNIPNEGYADPDCDAPGQLYHGRGYIQLTGCKNYKAASKHIFGDSRHLVENPSLVASDNSIAWRTAFWYWSALVHDAPGVQQGWFGATTKAINGRLECSEAGNEKALKRFMIYGKVRAAFGLPGAGDPSGCP